MKPKKRQKLCHHCEADVDLDVIVCPFCAADLREEKPEQQAKPAAPAVSRMAAEGQAGGGLYSSAPSYTVRGLPEETAVAQEEPADTEKNSISAIVLCTLGAQLFVLGLMMLFLGKGGMLILKWNAKWWPVYLVGALPLLFFGMKSIKKN